MNESQLFMLKAIEVHDKLIYPIARLTIDFAKNLYYDIEYELVALIIQEGDLRYYKNISLSIIDFQRLKSHNIDIIYAEKD